MDGFFNFAAILSFIEKMDGGLFQPYGLVSLDPARPVAKLGSDRGGMPPTKVWLLPNPNQPYRTIKSNRS